MHIKIKTGFASSFCRREFSYVLSTASLWSMVSPWHSGCVVPGLGTAFIITIFDDISFIVHIHGEEGFLFKV